MAAWLTYLKSRLLLPKPERETGDEPPATEVAASLAFRLAKLDAMRRAAEALKALPQTGRELFVRGDPDAIAIHATSRLDVGLYDLVRAYADQRKRQEGAAHYHAAARISALSARGGARAAARHAERYRDLDALIGARAGGGLSTPMSRGRAAPPTWPRRCPPGWSW